MEYVDWASFAASFLLVIGLILVTLWGFKRYGQMQFPKKHGDAAIQIIESHAIQNEVCLLFILIKLSNNNSEKELQNM